MIKLINLGNNLPRKWLFFIVILLAIGVFFRFANLEHKTYWHDEVYTSMRAAGYTRQEIDQELFNNRIIAVGELKKVSAPQTPKHCWGYNSLISSGRSTASAFILFDGTFLDADVW